MTVMNNKTLQNIALPTLALLLAGAVSSQAQPFAYEGFGYPSGTQLIGTTANGNGGIGWGSTWSATSAALATNTTGLSYAGLDTTMGAVLLGNPGGPSATASSQRMLSGTLGSLATTHTGGASGTIWISMLFQNLNDTMVNLGYREAKLALFSGATIAVNGSANVNGSERLDIGSPNTYAAGASDTLSLWQGSTYVSSGIATPRGANPINTAFLLMRIDVDNTVAADTAYAWFNPNILASAPSTASAISFSLNDLSGVNAFRLQAGNQNASGTNAFFKADELRVGFNYENVVPEPSVFALAGLGILALISRRRMS
jgi:hypothetical protein